MAKNLPALWEPWIRSLGQEDPLEEDMATHSRTLAWRIPWRGAWWATVHGVAERHDRVSNTQDAPCCPDLFSIHFKHPVRLPGSHQMHLSFSKSFLSPASHLQDESIPMGLFFSLCMAS